ncbi:MAG: nucleotide pyrophosphohydrolase, partial [Planctomycetota bacterium]|nr:nucleotide pyrophosphohydrolase [Planctomycetota bacterium]
LFEWENAILSGYRVWRSVYANRGGTVKLDLIRRTIEYAEPKG